MLLHEISRRSVYLNKPDEPRFSWLNSVISIMVNKYITFLDFSYDLQSTEKNLDLKENSVSYPNDSPVSTQTLQNYIQRGMKNVDLMEMVTNPLFRPHSKYLKKEMEGIKSLKCSPDNFINNSHCLIAVVNTFGNVNMLARSRCTYKDQLNFTEIIKDTQAPFPLDKVENIDQIKDYIYKVATDVICWAPNINKDKSCYFITLQNSGDILLWSLIYEKEVKSKFCGKIHINFESDIQDITWIPFTNENILLVCSNLAGQVIMYECNVACNSFKLIKEHIIWLHKDKMVVNVVHFFKSDEKIVLLFKKNRHVILQLLDKQVNVITQNILPVNDEKIVSIVNSGNEYYLGTINTKLYKLCVSVRSDDINYSLDAIDIKEHLQSHELVGIGISQSKAIFGLALKDRKLLYRKENIKVDLVFFSTNSDPSYHLCKLIDNSSQSLSNYFDCIELIRCNIFKSKSIPQYNYSSFLVEAETNLYKLKVYHIILMFYTSLKRSKLVAFTNLPNTDLEEIQEKILVAQAVKLLNNLKVELENKKQLYSFQSECFIGARKFLLYFCKKYKKCETNYIAQKTLELVNPNLNYVCQSCDGKLKGFSCSENAEHLNMFCSITFTPIEGNDYLVCEGCGLTARKDIYDETPTCVFCDKHFVQFQMKL